MYAAEGRGHPGVPPERRSGARGVDGDEVLRPAQSGGRDRQGAGRLKFVFIIFVYYLYLILICISVVKFFFSRC